MQRPDRSQSDRSHNKHQAIVRCCHDDMEHIDVDVEEQQSAILAMWSSISPSPPRETGDKPISRPGVGCMDFRADRASEDSIEVAAVALRVEWGLEQTTKLFPSCDLQHDRHRECL